MKKLIFLIFICYSSILANYNIDIKQANLPLASESEHFELYCMPEEKLDCQRVLDVAEENFKKCSVDFNHKYSAKINLYIFSNLQDLHNAVGQPSAPDRVINIYDEEKHYFLTVNPKHPGSYLSTESILNLNMHGLTYLFVKDKYKKEIPFWFVHGIGLLRSNYIDIKILNKLIQEHVLVPSLQQLEDFDSSSDIYRACSYLMIEFINSQWGWDKILAILADYASFEKILGVTKEAFRKEWINHLDASYIMESSTKAVMNIPTKKLHNGFEMPVYGFGTWSVGGRVERNFDNDDDADIAAIKAAIDSGIMHFDTAELYAGGYTEQLLGKAIKGYDRSKLFIVSKVKAANMAYENVIASCKKSLQRLETQYIDLYLLHSYNAKIDLKETMRALDTLVAEGIVKNIGVSNFSKERLTEAQSYTKNKIVCDQVHYNLQIRESEKNDLVQYCQQNDILLVAWRPVGNGVLLENVPPIIQEMCQKYNKSPVQIALNWLISQDNVVTISKTRSIEHLHENLGAIGWEMTKEDIETLRRVYPNQMDVSDVLPLDGRSVLQNKV